jgi:hypothetical protein
MRIAGVYSFNGGVEAVTANYADLLTEINDAIRVVDAAGCKTKESIEKTMMGRMLFSPKALNAAFKDAFFRRGWKPIRVSCDYPTTHYVKDYQARRMNPGAFREMDFVKNRLGVEVQFGKYAFMVYNVCAKMTIFHNLGHIDHGLEIVPVKGFAEEMSSGVSYFEQFVWDLEARGVADIDIPVMVLGIDCD